MAMHTETEVANEQDAQQVGRAAESSGESEGEQWFTVRIADDWSPPTMPQMPAASFRWKNIPRIL